ncbi:MAG: hypothetical protein N3E52_06850, partial [Candidatus Bathyarchaeota archaeon]|nr:hypothetical protein [Candidatus Bathyarchaeota archaeon]
GKYTVIARFAGSKAYYGSSAVTALVVGEAAPTATAEAASVAQAPVELYIAISTAAIIATIVIIGLLMLRKR